MANLNHLAIAKALGARIRPIGPVGFGNFRLRESKISIDKAIRSLDLQREPAQTFSYSEDAKVVQAFEDIRNGAPTDELLWNKQLAHEFVSKVQSYGLQAPPFYFIKRLLNVRKNAPRYLEHGIVIKPTSKKIVHPSIVSDYAHVIEFALVKIRFRYGVSIDDILMNPQLGELFEQVATQMAPSLTSKDLRLGALYIRKNRVVGRKEIEEINALDSRVMDSAWHGNVSLSRIKPKDVPEGPGLIELREERRYLYIGQYSNIHRAVNQLHGGSPFELVANRFWKPDLDQITLHYMSGDRIYGKSIGIWERKLVHDLDPVLNWPIPKKAG